MHDPKLANFTNTELVSYILGSDILSGDDLKTYIIALLVSRLETAIGSGDE